MNEEIKQLTDQCVKLSAATRVALLGLADMLVYLDSRKTVKAEDMTRKVREIQEAVYDEGFR